ncbi:MAG: CBS domain-containing protein [Candidatus Thermoplasmatota archaeon]|nr:CBS domain-containing protein [Candidatus Thermoplasmatota archaeon]MCL5731311.1 CBS domain-containing protein [Candidatus Thermoplasmatota archaeon]
MNVEDIMTEEVISLDAEETMSKAINRMRDNSIHSIPVTSNGKYAGMIVYRDLMKRRSIQPNSKVVNFMISTDTLSKGEAVESAIQKIHSSGLPSLPVVEKNKVVGIVSRFDLIKQLDRIMDISRIRNLEIKTSDPVYVEAEESADSAIEKIRDLDEYEAPVGDREGKLVGILRLERIVEQLMGDREKIPYGQYTSQRVRTKVIVSSIMENPVSVSDSDSVMETCQKMVSERLHMVPVTDRDMKITGVVSIDDIIDILASSHEREGFLVNISGLGIGDEDLYDISYGMAEKFVQKLGRNFGLTSGILNIHVIKYKEEGSVKYSVRTRLTAGRVYMSVNSFDWNFGKCLSDIFENYETRLSKTRRK